MKPSSYSKGNGTRPRGADLVNVSSLSPDILVELAYARPGNVFGRVFYSREVCCLLRPAAEALAQGQAILHGKGFGLKCLDCYRPLRVQREMWSLCPDPTFVAPPDRGSNHNKGIAVDLTLVDLEGRELPMPTPFDDFSPRASAGFMDLEEEVLRNRALLRDTMRSVGYVPYEEEWWHFDYAPLREAPLLHIDFDDL